MNGWFAVDQMRQTFASESFCRYLDTTLEKVRSSVANHQLGKFYDCLQELGVDYDEDEEVDAILDRLCILYVRFLEDLKEKTDDDWRYSFYFGNFAEKFKSLSSLEENHRWCSECHFSHGNHPDDVEWPSTLAEDASLFLNTTHADQIVPLKAKDDYQATVSASFVIFTDPYGTGHDIAAVATGGYLQSAFNAHVEVKDMSADVLLPASGLYQLGKIFGQKWHSAPAFNWIISNQLYWLDTLVKKIMHIVYKIFGWEGIHGIYPSGTKETSEIKAYVFKCFMQGRYNVAISTIHLEHNLIREVSEILKIPYMHLPTDMDPKMSEPYYSGVRPFSSVPFKVGIPYNDDEIKEAASPLSEDQTFLAGYPVREEFLTLYSDEEIAAFKEEKGIDPEATMVTIMTGGGGIQVEYPEVLANSPEIEEKLHVVVVAGNNNAFAEHLQRVLTLGDDGFLHGQNPLVSVEIAQERVIQNPERPYRLGGRSISLYQQASHVLITKPGGSTTGEGLYSRTPMLFDNTSSFWRTLFRFDSMFSWERFNAEKIKSWGYGDFFNSLEELPQAVMRVAATKKHLPSLDGILINTKEAVCAMAAEMLKQSNAFFPASAAAAPAA